MAGNTNSHDVENQGHYDIEINVEEFECKTRFEQ